MVTLPILTKFKDDECIFGIQSGRFFPTNRDGDNLNEEKLFYFSHQDRAELIANYAHIFKERDFINDKNFSLKADSEFDQAKFESVIKDKIKVILFLVILKNMYCFFYSS